MMAEADKRVATDTTLQATNTALGLLSKDSTLGQIKTALGLLAKNTTLQATNTTLELLAKDTTMQEIAEILCSVKSVNGKYDVVVLDSGDILISKSAQNSKTVKTVLTELQNAVSATPLSFTATSISGTEDDFKVTVTQGTPS